MAFVLPFSVKYDLKCIQFFSKSNKSHGEETEKVKKKKSKGTKKASLLSCLLIIRLLFSKEIH